MSANINVAAMRAYDLTMNLGVPNLNLPQVIFLLAMICAAYRAEKQALSCAAFWVFGQLDSSGLSINVPLLIKDR
jgi:hypothetical protein